MKKVFFVLGLGLVLLSCGKQCRECKYTTLKETVRETTCSSIKADREAFEERMDSTAKFYNSEVICTKENF